MWQVDDIHADGCQFLFCLFPALVPFPIVSDEDGIKRMSPP